MRQVAGVACITVAPQLAINFAKRGPSTVTSRGAITTLAPVIKGRKISKPAISKDKVVMAKKTSSSRRPGSQRIEQRKLTSDR